jgi:hypothetical protein
MITGWAGPNRRACRVGLFGCQKLLVRRKANAAQTAVAAVGAAGTPVLRRSVGLASGWHPFDFSSRPRARRHYGQVLRFADIKADGGNETVDLEPKVFDRPMFSGVGAENVAHKRSLSARGKLEPAGREITLETRLTNSAGRAAAADSRIPTPTASDRGSLAYADTHAQVAPPAKLAPGRFADPGDRGRWGVAIEIGFVGGRGRDVSRNEHMCDLTGRPAGGERERCGALGDGDANDDTDADVYVFDDGHGVAERAVGWRIGRPSEAVLAARLPVGEHCSARRHKVLTRGEAAFAHPTHSYRGAGGSLIARPAGARVSTCSSDPQRKAPK